jgi:hypothetical protein
MQGPGRTQPVALLFDSSLDEGIDQVLSLAMALALDSRREARLAGLSISRNSLETAAFAELMIRFYRGEQPGSAPGRATSPVGMFDGEAVTPAPRTISAVVDRIGPEGEPFYPRSVGKLNDTADPVAVLRNALSAQQDQHAVVVLAGPAVNLLGLMALPEGSELVRTKVRALVVSSAPGSAGVAGLVESWPGPVVWAGDDLNLRYPARAIEEDFVWAPNHPVVDAWRAAGNRTDVPAHAMAAVLYAVHPDEGYFDLSVPASGQTAGRLTTNAAGRERALQTIRELVSAMPPEPRRGGRGGFP